MEWHDIIASRRNYFVFTDEVVDKKIIKEVFEETYLYAPSQNLLFPYEVRLYRNNNTEIKKQLLELTHRNSNLDTENDPGNPQVLAPWLVGLTYIEKHNKKTASKDKRVDELELGILLTYISLGLKNRGIDTAFCKCIRDKNAVGQIFGTDRVDVMIAVGYGTNATKWNDLRTGTIKDTPYDVTIVPDSRINKQSQGLFDRVFKL